MTLFWLGLAWLSGIAISASTRLVLWQWAILALIAFIGYLGFRRSEGFPLLFPLVLLLCFGAIRFQIDHNNHPHDHIAQYNDNGEYATIKGIVVKPPDVRDAYIGLQIDAEEVRFGEPGTSIPIHGRILVQATRFGDWEYGDRLLVKGFLQTPPEYEAFSYREYLARYDMYTLVRRAEVKRLDVELGNPILYRIYSIRAHALRTIQRLFPDPEASLLSGILVGEEEGIPPEVTEDFNATGTTHIIAISGFNITIIAAILTSLFRRLLGARIGILVSIIGITFYTILVGADAAVVRAAIMGSLTLFAYMLGRQTYAYASLAAAAIFMTALNPDVLWDIGFQLSFAATLGLILYAPGLESGFRQLASKFLEKDHVDRISPPFSEFVLFTLAAQVTTLPLTAYYFQRLPLSSLIANPVILPVQPALMISGGLATLAGMVWEPLGRPLAWIAWIFPAFTIRAVSFFASLPLGNLHLGRLSTLAVASFYLILFGLTGYFKIRPELRPRLRAPHISASSGILVLALITLVTWRVSVDRPDGLLHITLLDVGSGDSTLIQSPTGRFVLVDGGPSSIALSDALGARLPLLERGIDWLILGSTSEGQLGGLPDVIPRFSPANVLYSGPPRLGPYRYLMDQLTEAEIPMVEAQSGHSLDLGDGASLKVIAIGDHGAVMQLEYGSFSFLLAPGADPKLVTEFMRGGRIRPVTALLLPDSGNESVNPPQWLEQLQPQVALISVGAGNLDGFPSPGVLQALENTSTLRTDLHGWIEIRTDGEEMWLEVERGMSMKSSHYD